MHEQERKIVRVLINEMAFEGAAKHFNENPPNISKEIFERIESIGIPLKYNQQNYSYEYASINFDARKSVYENCYSVLRLLRNNIIHANKAFRPSTPERLTALLDWAEQFIDAVYATNSPFAKRALSIKQTMKTESFN